jgi:RNA polymerase sigma-70 factor (ECF subfamily)
LPPCNKTLADARAGDELAMELLIRDYQTRVARFVVSRTSAGPHVEDICQAIFVKMVLGLERLGNDAAFESWLFRIAQNACRDHLRRRLGWRRLFVPFGPEHEEVAEPEELPGAGLDRLALARQALAGMPATDRTLIELAAQNRRYDEMAALTGIGVGALKSRLFRARERLRSLVADLVRKEEGDA